MVDETGLVERLQAENDGLECALRIRIWNECKQRGMRDEDAYRRIKAEVEAVKTEAITALQNGASNGR